MSGCVRCGSDRLKSAPVIGIDGVLARARGRRRYRCAECGAVSWHRRLRRRAGGQPRSSARLIVSAVVITLIFASAIALTMSVPGCPDPGLKNTVADAPGEGGHP